MNPGHRFFPQLDREVEIPKDGITSRALTSDDSVRVVIFGFDTGQELSEHTASMPATLHILKGEATITLDEETFEGTAGSFACMEAHLPHSIVAKTPVILLLTMIKAAKTPKPA